MNTPQKHIMLDLETLGSTPGSVILSIGACEFADGKIASEFYRRIDPESCIRAGLHVDIDTVLWWMKQSDDARLELTKVGDEIEYVLDAFRIWVFDEKVCCMWGNGAAFDNVLLAEAYRKCGIELPWKYSNDRCYRTIKSLHPEIEIERTGTHHNALEDAKSQALHLMRIFAK